MSFGPRSLAVIPSNPLLVVALATGLALAALPLTNATHLGTGSPDARFDASAWTSAYYQGVYFGEQSVQTHGTNLTYATGAEITIVGIVANGTTQVELRSPNGTIVALTSLTTGPDGPGGSLRNATFLAQSGTFSVSGLYRVTRAENASATVAGLFVGPRNDMSVITSPSVVEHQPNATFAMTVSTGAPGAALQGDHVPANATTGSDGNYTFMAAMPEPGTYVVRASLDLGGDWIPERTGVGSYSVASAAAQFVQYDLQVPNSTFVGEPVDVFVRVRNDGEASGDGTISLLVNAAVRDSQLVTLDPGQERIVNFSFTPTVAGTYWVTTQVGNATLPAKALTVSTASPPAAFSVGNVTGGILAPVAVPIAMSGVHDFGSATVTLAVDTTVVEVVNVTTGNVTGATTTWSFNESTGTLTLLLTTSARPGVSGDFVFATVWITAAGSAGSTSALDLEVVELVDSDGVDLPATARDGSFRAGILGDADGDGDVDTDDVQAIADAVVGKRSLASIVVADADVSRDGALTGRDAMLLSQHLAGTRPQL